MAKVMTAAKQRGNEGPLAIESWIGSFVSGRETAAGSDLEKGMETASDSGSMDSRADRAIDRAKDVQAFDALLSRHTESLGRLKAQGIDLDAEKDRERERLRSASPGMPEAEARTRSALAVYLRHADAIRSAAPDESARKELDAGLDRLRPYARELSIPHVETVRNAAGILPADKAAIIAATRGTGFDTRTTRKGDELRFESASDRVAQVWSLIAGERPEKSVEIPNGPRIRIATVPEPDAALVRQRFRAVADVEALTGWEGVRTPDGLDTARARFPKALEASLTDASSAKCLARFRTSLLGSEQGERKGPSFRNGGQGFRSFGSRAQEADDARH